MRRQKPKKDHFQALLAELLEQMSQGNAPWVRPWQDMGPPRQAFTNRPYGFFNALILASANFADPRFCTFRQAKEQGGYVRKGEKAGAAICRAYTIRFSLDAVEPDEEDQDQPLERIIQRARWYPVFNVSQIEGLDLPPLIREADHQRIAHIDRFIAATGLRFEERPNNAFYSKSRDVINVPPLAHFTDVEGYYGTVFHEMIHWTAPRLGRTLGLFGSPEYAFEELVAELGASFLCMHFRVNGRLQHAATYLKGWIRILEDQPAAWYKASHLAQQAFDFLSQFFPTPLPSPSSDEPDTV